MSERRRAILQPHCSVKWIRIYLYTEHSRYMNTCINRLALCRGYSAQQKNDSAVQKGYSGKFLIQKITTPSKLLWCDPSPFSPFSTGITSVCIQASRHILVHKNKQDIRCKSSKWWMLLIRMMMTGGRMGYSLYRPDLIWLTNCIAGYLLERILDEKAFYAVFSSDDGLTFCDWK